MGAHSAHMLAHSHTHSDHGVTSHSSNQGPAATSHAAPLALPNWPMAGPAPQALHQPTTLLLFGRGLAGFQPRAPASMAQQGRRHPSTDPSLQAPLPSFLCYPGHNGASRCALSPLAATGDTPIRRPAAATSQPKLGRRHPPTDPSLQAPLPSFLPLLPGTKRCLKRRSHPTGKPQATPPSVALPLPLPTNQPKLGRRHPSAAPHTLSSHSLKSLGQSGASRGGHRGLAQNGETTHLNAFPNLLPRSFCLPTPQPSGRCHPSTAPTY